MVVREESIAEHRYLKILFDRDEVGSSDVLVVIQNSEFDGLGRNRGHRDRILLARFNMDVEWLLVWSGCWICSNE